MVAQGSAEVGASGSGPSVPVVHDRHDARLAAARDAAAQVTAWQARLVAAVAELLDDPVADAWRPYLAHQLGLTPTEAAQLLELADRLTELPGVAAVFARGERSLGAVLALARRATPDNEDVLLAGAEHLTGGQLQRMLAEYERVVAPAERSDAPPEDPQDQPSTARNRRCPTGRRHVVLDLDEADAAEWDSAIDAERNRLDTIDGDQAAAGPHARTYGAAAMALVRRATAARGTRSSEPAYAPDTVKTTLVLHAHETDEGLVLDRAALAGETIPSWMLGMLLEQGELTALVAWHGEPLIATSPTRFATAEQRRALLVRDRHCQYPGCRCDTGLIAHHIRYYEHHGPTKLDNLVLVCKRHHRVVHRYALRIEREAPHGTSPPRWRFTTSTGGPLDPSRPHRPVERRPTTVAERRTGTHEPLTAFAKDVLLHSWLPTVPVAA